MPRSHKKRLFNRGPVGLCIGLCAIAITLLKAIPPAGSTELSHIYAFGDSLSDTGNTFAKTGVPPEPYFEGHFSNGPIWAEYLANDLGVGETNLAYGGALSGELQIGSTAAVQAPSVLSQVQTFVADSLANSDRLDEKALYIIWVGANDYLSGQQRDPSVPVANIRRAVSILNQAGAKNFLLVNLPKLGDLPLFRRAGTPAAAASALNNLSIQHNEALAETVANLNQSETIKVQLLDVDSLYDSAIAQALGPIDTTDACTLVPTCVADPGTQNSYLFWDSIHPTTAAHRIIANSALALVGSQ